MQGSFRIYLAIRAAMKAAFIGVAPILVILAGLQGTPAQAKGTGGVIAETRTPLVVSAASATATPGCIPNPEVVDSPNRPSTNELYGADALSPGDVWAVGSYMRSNYGNSFTLVEHWDGTAWTQVDSPNPTPTPTSVDNNVLKAVSARAPDDVWAVGYGGRSRTLVEHWNGTTWSIVPSPNPGTEPSQNLLYGVTAVAANDVWAVGSTISQTNSGALILHWDGAQWSVVDNTLVGTLYSVDAVAANDIWAVGSSLGQYPGGLAAHWDGSAWTQIPAPNPDQSLGEFYSVSALSSTDAWAVGSYTTMNGRNTLTEHWNGTQWKIVDSPNHSSNVVNELRSVEVAPDHTAWAVGSYVTPGYSMDPLDSTLVERWDGTRWTIVPSTDIQPDYYANKFYSVALTSDNNAWAVGSHGYADTLIERYQGGQWVVEPSPSPGLGSNYLNGVSALSPEDIWAVGYVQAAAGPGMYSRMRALTEHWDGARWNIVPVQAGGPGTDNMLNGVVAIAPNDVWAVGWEGAYTDLMHTLVLHWDGTRWSVVDSPNPDSEHDMLNAVAAFGPNDVYAAGNLGYLDSAAMLVVHWNGSAWTLVVDPALQLSGELNAIGGTGPNDIWVAGESGTYSNFRPTILHFGGTAWTEAQLPYWHGVLDGITSISAGDAWAVGFTYEDPASKTLTLHWDGGTWTQVASPNIPLPGYGTYLSGVSGKASNDVWAAGYWASGVNGFTWLQHWDGHSWTHIESPNPGVIRNMLADVVELAPGDVWAVGSQIGVVAQTLTEHVGRFADVEPGDYFYTAVNYLVSRGAISGYSDCTFRPAANTTRGQLTKIVVLAEGWPISTHAGPHFEDVPVRSPFYQYIETAYNHGVISGYRDGTFRPNNDVTRSQLSKIIVLAQGWATDTTGGPHFTDVPAGSTFYDFVETAYHHGVISGYADHTFRGGNSATRGQLSKIVYNAVR